MHLDKWLEGVVKDLEEKYIDEEVDAPYYYQLIVLHSNAENLLMLIQNTWADKE